MIALLASLALAAPAGGGHDLGAFALPVCGNRAIGEVVKRVGCTVGDARCWMRKRGFCLDYVEERTGVGDVTRMRSVAQAEVRKGDVAAFVMRSHYAYVERVVRGPDGKPVAVDLSEWNFGTCWVDRDFMVTDRYKRVNRRSRVALGEVDGGFLRPASPPPRRN